MEQQLEFEHPFVAFAASAIKNTLIIEALTCLQREYHLNINLLLYTLWYGLSQHGRLLKQEIKALLQSVHAWHERILAPLKRLGDSLPTLEALVCPEIEAAENIERQLIASTLFKGNFQKRNPAQQLSDACHNVASYCKIMSTQITSENQQAIIALLQAYFPNLIAAEITHAYEHSLHHSANTESQENFSQLTLSDL